ncbi:MAG TPA: ABC-type transport auxiliary lipoprotein family protein, partial [Gammaproteobacteria bacterium]|nr:ABC-type transport auxiliary lipoprotein family protein [Gammaproteobacteria bacterium]
MNTRIEAALVAIAMGALLSGCVRPVREQLVSLSSVPDSSGTSRDAPAVTISLGRVNVPEYLDGYDIVSRASPHELERDAHSRWAERLPEASARVLRAALAEQGLRVVDGDASTVTVNIAAFEPTADGVVLLSATWQVSNVHHDPIGRGAGVIEQPAGAGAAAQAAAMESALQRLAGDIATTIKGVADV